ncbi:MAG: DUF2892 domain-containing protein [Undibacterium umbellatum]|uniref:YgaP family membrane protein n=1 Tax=Undibacterium umbellatum TaxID=2762300 RepID=UPI003BB4B4C7
MFHIKRNLPHWERALRIISGVALGWLAFSGQFQGTLNWIIIASAVTMVMTAFVGFCPACAMVGRKYLDN